MVLGNVGLVGLSVRGELVWGLMLGSLGQKGISREQIYSDSTLQSIRGQPDPRCQVVASGDLDRCGVLFPSLRLSDHDRFEVIGV